MKEYIVQAIAQETIDSFDVHNAPELIRCKDCKHGRIYDGRNGKLVACEFEEFSKDLNWFCADGVKRDE